MDDRGRRVKSLISPLLAVLLSFAAAALFLAVIGENPWLLFKSVEKTLFTSFGLGYALFYSTPLVFTGLAVAMSFQCGLFNIGAEGQLYVGSVCLIAFAALLPNCPAIVAIPSAIGASMLGGAVWGGIAGFLKAKRGSHEVIVTIMLNFIGLSLVDYLILYRFKSIDTPNPETNLLPSGYQIWTLADIFQKFGLAWLTSTPANVSLVIAIAASLACWICLRGTTFGFELRSVGKNPRASQYAGISVSKNTILALALSGALAGLVGVNEIMGYQHRLIQGFSPLYGFTGIAVALLARNHPLGILFSAFLFGVLTNSTRELEFLSDKVSKELSFVLQGLLIALVSAEYLIERFFSKRRSAKQGAAS
jgi:general nucleoside transport system permease protein